MTILERGVVEYKTFSGVTLLVTPLSVSTITAIAERSRAEYPDIDDTPFRLEIPHSAVPGAWDLDVENPEYQRLLGELHANRTRLVDRLFFELGTEFADKKTDLLKTFKDRIEKLRTALALTDSDETILLFHIALARTEDAMNVTKIIRDRVPITAEEVADGLRIFRTDLQRNGLHHPARPTPGVPAADRENTGDVVES